MIKLPNLDDQTYSEIVEAAKRRIPVIFPEWTDFNEHDPGITVLETFAWLKEMQQYYLNRISDANRINMLKLMGISPREAAPAVLKSCFCSDSTPERMVKGTAAVTSDGIEYMLEECFAREPFTIGRIYIDNENGIVDVTDIASGADTGFYPFGKHLNGGSRSLFIELCRVEGEKLSDCVNLSFDISDEYPVKRNPFGEQGENPRIIEWEYSTADGFVPCEIIGDETHALSFSGAVKLRTGDDFAKLTGSELPEGRWICARLTECGCEDMPLLRSIYNNSVTLVQKKRFSDFAEVCADTDIVAIEDALCTDGTCFVMIRDSFGWLIAENVEVMPNSGGALVALGDYFSMLAADGEPNVRVVFCRDEFGANRMFMSSDGLPQQQYELDNGGQLMVNDLRVMVRDRADSDNPRWRDFGYVESLALAGAYDCVFTYDEQRRMLCFGDNENGEVPAYGTDNIMIVSCASTEGARGNISGSNISQLGGYTLTRQENGRGGTDRETLRHAMERLKASMTHTDRAVTAEDYRTLALQTPGIRIADVRAIPFFDAELTTASEDKLTNVVTLVVIPYSTEKFPMPDARFMRAVKRHIEQYRLITTQIKIAAPRYVRVNISAQLICGTRETAEAKRCAEKALRGHLSIFDSGGRAHFGEPLNETDVISVICSVEGVLSVKNVRISVSDPACSRDRYGRITIPPNAITYCGSVELEITEP